MKHASRSGVVRKRATFSSCRVAFLVLYPRVSDHRIANNINMQHIIMMCSATNEKITPVPNCMHMLTATVTMKMLNEAMFETLSDSLLLTTDKAINPMHMQVIAVPESLDSWSRALGMLVVRSTGSFATIAKRVSVTELSEKRRQGI
ncbi:hypothetical protein Sjap_009477 [Stephania japonica]|uniref:Uncharacterized protein n=1 Tax=Stephania japonica TaxID=461633 RepID=A0AAP0JRE2_9MAGN